MGLENFILTCEKDNEQLRKDIDYYKNYNKRLEKQNKQLKEQLESSEKARKEAIDYINKKANKGYNFGWVLQNEEIDKLLEILDIDKGE